MTLTYFSRSWGSISTWKFAIFTYKLDKLTNISCIGSKLIPWMYSRSVLVKFKDGWPWLVFRCHGGWFQHGNLQFSLVNTITQQILVALGPNLNHGCILRMTWLSSKMDDLDLFFEVLGVRFQHANLQFVLVNKLNMVTQQILVVLGPNLYHGCIIYIVYQQCLG